MRAGAHLRELSRLRRGLAVAFVFACAAALLSVYKVGLLPPSLTSRSLEIGAASTEILVDTPHSSIADLRAGGTDFSQLTTRTDLLGNVLASAPVESYIGRYVGVNPASIHVTTPITASVPRLVVEPGSGQSATDIIASADHYKLEVQADPSVPILHLYAQAPTQAAAVKLANGAVEALRSYVNDISVSQRIGPAQRVRLAQFGPARGGVVNSGVTVQIALLAFLATFGICCFIALLVTRVSRGFKLAALAGQAVP